ncbi:MAG: TIGR03364 family FAD-dependent oxidoreductase [Pseudomonadota bacterium]
MSNPSHFDLIVVGAGILGCAHALAAARHGKSVLLLERDARANEASIRNFGFVTITGQQVGQVHTRALRSRDIWRDVAAGAGIAVHHQGLLVAAHSPEADAVLEAFMQTEMAEGCERLTAAQAIERCPQLNPEGLTSALHSSHELRVEPREALPKIAAWLQEVQGVVLHFGQQVQAVEASDLSCQVVTTDATFESDAVAVCSGNDFRTLFRERLAAYDLQLCKLQMARVAPQPAGWRLPAAVMSDTSLVRYLGYAELPEADALRRRLEQEVPETLAAGVHLIVVQGADGSLTIGDSHHNGPAADPFYDEAVADLFVAELRKTLHVPNASLVERWNGYYPVSPGRIALIDRPHARVRLALITSGTGMSTAFAIGEEVVAELF